MIEYDCKECGMHVIRMIGTMPEPAICCHCEYLPGWYKDPVLARVIPYKPGPRDEL